MRSRDRESDRWAWLVPVVGLPLLLALPFLAGKSILFRDLSLFVPQGTWLARALSAGKLPEWDPLRFGGIPFLADPGTGVFYPPSALAYFAFRTFRAETAFVLAHLPLAAAGAFLLGRRIGLGRLAAAFASVAYAGSGYLLSIHSTHYGFVAAALLPGALAMLLRSGDRSAPALERALAAVAVALLVFNGELQGLAIVAGLALAVALARPRTGFGSAGRILLLLAAGCGLSAIQLLPTLRFAAMTDRALGFTLSVASEWALHPARWIEFLVPAPFGLPYPGDGYWGSSFVAGPTEVPWAVSLYLGPSVLLLAALAPLRRLTLELKVLAALGILSLAVAGGNHLPLFRPFYEVVPFFDRFRYPEKFAVVFTLAVALLAGRGFEELIAFRVSTRSRNAPAWLALGLAAALAATGLTVRALEDEILPYIAAHGVRLGAPFDAETALFALARSFDRAALVAGAVGLLALLRGPRILLRGPLLLALVMLDLGGHGQRVLSYGDASFAQDPPEVLREIEQARVLGSSGRVFRIPTCTFTGEGRGTTPIERRRRWEWNSGADNYLTLFGIPLAQGYDPFDFPWIERLIEAARAHPKTTMDVLGASLVLRCDERGHVGVLTRSPPVPRAGILPATPVADPLPALVDPAFPLFESALVEGPPSLRSNGQGTAEVIDVDAEEVHVRTTGTGGLLVLFDSFADGWSATVDGSPAPLWRVNGRWRGVQVPPGEARVEFRYATPGLRAGALISLGTAVALATLLMGFGRSRSSR